MLKNTIFNISIKVIGIANSISIFIVINNPKPKYAMAVNAFDSPIIDNSGCTGLNKILSNSPCLIYFDPISYKESKQKSRIPIDINVTPYNKRIC